MVNDSYLEEFSTDMSHATYAADESDQVDPGEPPFSDVA
jgi:hypothetical protein